MRSEAPYTPLCKALAASFDDAAKIPGQTLFVQARVHADMGSAHRVTATIEGERRYRVELERRFGDELFARCDCVRTAPCEHVWATLLMADRLGYLATPGVPPPSSVRLARRLAPSEVGEVLRALQGHSARSDVAGLVAARWPTEVLAPVRAPRPPPLPAWELFLAATRRDKREPKNRPRTIAFVVNPHDTRQSGELVLDLYQRTVHRKTGDWTAWRAARSGASGGVDEASRASLSLLRGVRPRERYGSYSFLGTRAEPTSFQIAGAGVEAHLPRLAAAGQLFLSGRDGGEPTPLAWDPGEPFEPVVELRAGPDGLRLEVGLRRGAERLDPASLVTFTREVLVVIDRVARLSPEARGWLESRPHGGLLVAPGDVERFLCAFYGAPEPPALVLPAEHALAEVRVDPRFRAHLGAPEAYDMLPLEVAFAYDEVIVADDDPRGVVVDYPRRRLLPRDRDRERAAIEALLALGVKRARGGPKKAHFALPAPRAPRVLRALLAAGWHVEATGKVWRQASTLRMNVTSGVDWFDLEGGADYDGAGVSLPALLAAVRRGESTVTLDDGTLGVLPEEWLARWRVLADLGEIEGDHLRFKKNQIGVLDALLEAEPTVAYDAAFHKLREALRAGKTAAPREAPRGFVGQLRDYQREGLGWMELLARTGFGGCLADDMGLGKTIQVLAWLLTRRRERRGKGHGPSLVVAPRSLVFNWQDEAARFTPELRILDHTGAQRLAPSEHFQGYDLVLTTYGTLRRDAVALAEVTFDYVILDEAQAVKNADSASFKAARALRAEHRLALTGTPIENHVGELFTLFEFLNPSMLGPSQRTLARRQLDAPGLALVGRALRPFILRRTKQEVVRELPDKTELTLHCELDPDERALYDQLARHYRESLLGLVKKSGMKGATFHVLEALLRLRQAACHPGLVDKARAKGSSAKVDTLLGELASVVRQGHKALVFSQFTSLLAIVRARLDAAGVAYEYLDGKTRDRAARVARFQGDAACPVFLVSLKAGGVGLNLTAAEYVFILDPWWNPAVEAQAVDRAHRIGQARPVFAYRIIAKGTVEEKVAELQRTKSAVAQAILGAGEEGEAKGSVLGDLSVEELASLLA